MKKTMMAFVAAVGLGCHPAYAEDVALNQEAFYNACIHSTAYPPLPLASDEVYCQCQTEETARFVESGTIGISETEPYIGRVVEFFHNNDIYVLGSYVKHFNHIYQQCMAERVQVLEENPVDIQERIKQIMEHQERQNVPVFHF